MINPRPSALTRLSTVITSISVVAVAACGGAGAGEPAKSPAQQETMDDVRDGELTSIEQAEKAIARAKVELAAAGAGDGAAATGSAKAAEAPADTSASPEAEPAPSPATPQAAEPRAGTRAEAPSKSALAGADRCASPCRAIASMRRAVTALCRMTGDDDTRCVEAKHTLTDSEKRIDGCSC